MVLLGINGTSDSVLREFHYHPTNKTRSDSVRSISTEDY